MPYKVYFEIGGKKMMMKVSALSEHEAKEAVIKKIIFHKVEAEKISSKEVDETVDFFKKFFNIK